MSSHPRPVPSEPPAGDGPSGPEPQARRFRGWYLALACLVLLVAAAGGLLFAGTRGGLKADPSALARVTLPLGGQIQSATAVDPRGRAIPLEVRGDRLWPTGLVPAHEAVTVDVVVSRPGWISWLAGSTQHLHLTLQTPSLQLRDQYLTLRPGAPLRIGFDSPAVAVTYGPQGRVRRHVLPGPQTELTLPRTTEAGTLAVSAVPRTWERAHSVLVSWFPPQAHRISAVASVEPGTQIGARTPITLTFSKPVARTVAGSAPRISPATEGSWRAVNAHTMTFTPHGFGYGIGTAVRVSLPSNIQIVGGARTATSSTATWTVPGGKLLRAQQLLADLGYLPLRWRPASHVAATVSAQEGAAVNPPPGTFLWRYHDAPTALRDMWKPGASGVVTQGALMAFENDHNMTTDGVMGPAVWRALISAAVAHKRSTFGYTFVQVDESSQSLNLWHDGHTLVTTPVNTGIASAPTATGTYPVFEHIRVGTMSGTNPDGSHYDDPGIQYISYFNGGDALHAFTRAQYGFPQSLGCVEMALGPAGQVYPYTPIGTLVNVQ